MNHTLCSNLFFHLPKIKYGKMLSLLPHKFNAMDPDGSYSQDSLKLKS